MSNESNAEKLVLIILVLACLGVVYNMATTTMRIRQESRDYWNYYYTVRSHRVHAPPISYSVTRESLRFKSAPYPLDVGYDRFGEYSVYVFLLPNDRIDLVWVRN